MTTVRKFRIAVLLLVLGCTVGCDQTTKTDVIVMTGAALLALALWQQQRATASKD